jgi:diguanylate cyclase (GGDEF)-like protein
MREAQKHDIVLLIGLALTLVVMFQEPLGILFSAGQALQDRYGLALVPGLAVLCLIFRAHHALERVRRASTKKQTTQFERFIRLGQALNHATTLEQLRELLNYHLPRAVGSDGVWVLIQMDGDGETLVGRSPKALYGADLASKARADRFLQLDSDRVDVVRGNEIAGHLCFRLSFGTQRVGVMGLPISSCDPHNARRELASISALLGISARNVELIEEIKAHGVLDGLNKCLNRTHGMNMLDAELQRAKRSRTTLSLLMLDLDGFKSVNDEYGHLCGDALVAAVGRKMHEFVRNSDLKLRYGGEKFLIMLPGTPLPGAIHVVRVLNKEIGKISVEWNNHVVSRTASVGVAASKPGELDTTQLLGRADAALYRARRDGRDRVCVDGETLGEPLALEESESENRLAVVAAS